MIRIDKVSTKAGDGGATGLSDGSRVSKDDLRIEVLGALDEANAALGVLRLHAEPGCHPSLSQVQNTLFDIGGVLCAPGPARILASLPAKVDDLTAAVEECAASLPPLTSFILPGGSPASAYCHLARTIVRRTERRVVALHRTTPVDPQVLRYLNRLSDFLFVLARKLNDRGAQDVLWKPDRSG
jgi:cob(I)alamin adenosyltransferase